MPATSFMIQYKPNDFFYNIADPIRNAELLETFPFKKEKVIEWVNKVANLEKPLVDVIDIFDPQISVVILNPDYDFKNSFLPGNMVFNDNFDELTMNLTGMSGSAGSDGSSGSSGSSGISNNLSNQSTVITGNIVLNPISKNDKPTTLEINSDGTSNINWQQDKTNSWQSSFNINTGLSKQIPFIDVDGGESEIIMTSGNPRCKFRAVCTMNHWHYSGECTTKIIEENGTTRCECNCTGVPVFNGNPHSHCDPYVIDPNGNASTPLGPATAPTGLGLVAAIQGLKMNLKANFPQSKFLKGGRGGTGGGSGGEGTEGGEGGDIVLPYKDEGGLNQNSKTIRQLVFDYYSAVNENITLQKTIQSKGAKDITSKQALMDATVQYKTEYLNVFNIIAGIAGVAGYIYLLVNETGLPPVNLVKKQPLDIK